VKDYRCLKFPTNGKPQVYKSQCRNKRNMRKQRNMTTSKLNNCTTTNTNDKEVNKISDNELTK
jgi:hypothetical protein